MVKRRETSQSTLVSLLKGLLWQIIFYAHLYTSSLKAKPCRDSVIIPFLLKSQLPNFSILDFRSLSCFRTLDRPPSLYKMLWWAGAVIMASAWYLFPQTKYMSHRLTSEVLLWLLPMLICCKSPIYVLVITKLSLIMPFAYTGQQRTSTS